MKGIIRLYLLCSELICSHKSIKLLQVIVIQIFQLVLHEYFNGNAFGVDF